MWLFVAMGWRKPFILSNGNSESTIKGPKSEAHRRDAGQVMVRDVG